MYVIVAGGGKVGRYLTEMLINAGHEVLLIEKNRSKVDQYAELFGGVVVQGDACEMQTLAEAGVARADVLIAVTGDDEDNLVSCQIAKRKYNVGRVIARVNNPKNERIFKALGIDATVSHTQALLQIIEQELPTNNLHHMMLLRDNNLELVDVVIGLKSPVLGKPINTLTFPPDSAILLVIRNGKIVVPRGDLVLQERDEIVAITPRNVETSIKQMLVGDY